MLTWLRQRRSTDRIARALYGSSVTAARAPALYRDLGVPDTLAGRFEMVVLHTFLLMHRLSAEGPRGRAVAQTLAEAMIEQFDDDMRQLGVSDITVPKKIRKVASAAYGRFEAYAAAVESRDGAALTAALLRNAFDNDQSSTAAAETLARWIIDRVTDLSQLPAEGLLRGEAALPGFTGGQT
ncbi:MAG: ubiquinol-cytochrome C chaperone family protein [Hyphomicrobiaceae bacterium]